MSSIPGLFSKQFSRRYNKNTVSFTLNHVQTVKLIALEYDYLNRKRSQTFLFLRLVEFEVSSWWFWECWYLFRVLNPGNLFTRYSDEVCKWILNTKIVKKGYLIFEFLCPFVIFFSIYLSRLAGGWRLGSKKRKQNYKHISLESGVMGLRSYSFFVVNLFFM